MYRTISLLALACAIVVTGAALAQAPMQENAAIEELMELTGAGELGAQVAESLLAQLKPLFPNVPEELWTEFAASLNADEVKALVVPIYARHLSLEEINGLLAFYKTPVGRRILEVQDDITVESLALGQQWGAAKAQELVDQLAERGYEPVAL